MTWRNVGTVLVKELKETLRDRRTLFIMIVIPVLLYPGMLVLLEQITLFGQRSLGANTPTVAVVGEAGAAAGFLARDGAVTLVYADAPPIEALRGGSIDAILVFPADGLQDRETSRVELLYDRTQDRSGHAYGVIQRRLGEYADTLLARRLEAQGLGRGFALPLTVDDRSIATAEQLGGYALGRFLPLLLILMTVLGAFYPSIDMAAGEKERGTLETLLTAPVPADEIVAGKFVAAGIMGFVAAALNLISILVTFQSGLVRFGGALNLQFHIPLHAVLIIFAVLLLLSVLFSALFLGIAVRSESFKEAQNTLTPVYILSFLPALLATMPGVEFTPAVAMIPVGGVAFLFRDLMGGSVPFEPAVLAVCTTILYTLMALVYAARSFGREDVLFGGRGGDVDTTPLAARLRRWRSARRTRPTAGEAALLVTFVALLFFYVARPLTIAAGENGIWLSQLLLLAVPVAIFLLVARKDVRSSLALRRAPPRAFAAALLIVLGGIPISWFVVWLQGFVLAIPPEYLRAMEQLVSAADTRRMLWLLFVVALVPAVCEELLFRGVLLQGLGRESMWRAVGISAAVFGGFHLSFETAIRFLPTAWLGVLLAYVVWRTRSIFTGMLMHLVNNGLVVLIVSLPLLRERLLDPSGQPPWALVAVAPLLLWAGVRALPRRSTQAAAAPRDGGAGEAVQPA